MHSKRISTEWISNLKSDKEKKDFEESLRNQLNTQVYKRLVEILKTKTNNIQLNKISIEDYSSPNWSERQAHYNGKVEALLEILRLLDFKE